MNANTFVEGLTTFDPTIHHAVEIVSSYVGKHHVPAAELPGLIALIHAAINGLGKSSEQVAASVTKATPAEIKKSITADALISFEDGKSYKTLRRHLTMRGLSPEAYRAKHGLPVDYPMVAQSYSDRRSQISLAMGLGRKRPANATAA